VCVCVCVYIPGNPEGKVAFGEVGASSVTEEDEVFIVIAPQSMVGASVYEPLAEMTAAAKGRPMVLFVCVCVCVCARARARVCVCVCACICIYVCMYVCMHIRMYVCIYVCMYCTYIIIHILGVDQRTAQGQTVVRKPHVCWRCVATVLLMGCYCVANVLLMCC
jgi:hypothetical protein